jgi:hypothetical protein
MATVTYDKEVTALLVIDPYAAGCVGAVNPDGRFDRRRSVPRRVRPFRM